MMRFFNNLNLDKKYGFLFFILIALKYLVEYCLWGDFFVHRHDNLDSDIVYNNAIGNFYRGSLDTSAIEVFLNGNIKWYYLIRALQPMIFLYVIFTAKTAYFLTEIIVIFLAYLSMLSCLRYGKKFTKQAYLFAIFFAFSLSYTTYGLGVACFPYVMSLLWDNSKRINPLNLSLLVLIGANSLLAMHVIFYPILIWFSSKFYNQKVNYQKTYIVLLAIIGGSALTASGLIYAQFFSEPSHRTLWATREEINIIETLKFIFFQSFTLNEYYHSYVTPIFYVIPLLLAGLISDNKALRRNSIFLMLFLFLTLWLKTFGSELWYLTGPLKSIQFDRIGLFIGIFLTIFGYNFYLLEKRKYSKVIISTFLLFYFIHALLSRVGIYENIQNNIISKISYNQKNKLKTYLKEGEYKRFLKMGYLFAVDVDWVKVTPSTFSSYYKSEVYSCIKSFTKDRRVMSVGIDPMIAAFNGLPVIDGYHNFYPAFYKAQFRAVIDKQIEEANKAEYFDRWGSRVYTFVESTNNIKLNYNEALKLGAKYTISAFLLNDKSLVKIDLPCNSGNLHLYQIQ